MTGFAAFARKEAWEILRTWRIWVLPGILLFFALTGPLVARFTPEFIEAVAGDQLEGLQLPTPTPADAYAQWVKNLSQIGLVSVIIIYGGIVSSEVRSGTAPLVLTKPVSRTAFVVAKATVQSAFLAIVTLVGTVITWALTAVTFGQAPAPGLWSAALVWLVLGVLFVAVMTLLSTLIGSPAGAAGAGLGVYALLAILGIWKPLGTYSPAGLGSHAAGLAAGQHPVVLWSVLTSLLLCVFLVYLAARVFRRSDL